jgi:hypothetical protein
MDSGGIAYLSRIVAQMDVSGIWKASSNTAELPDKDRFGQWRVQGELNFGKEPRDLVESFPRLQHADFIEVAKDRLGARNPQGVPMEGA